MKTKITLGESVRIEVTRSICINIDNPIFQVVRYETPRFIYSLAYDKIRIPAWSLVTLEIYDELYINTKSPVRVRR